MEAQLAQVFPFEVGARATERGKRNALMWREF
jgi:hypothetical protein